METRLNFRSPLFLQPREQDEQALRSLLEAETRAPFDLARTPGMRVIVAHPSDRGSWIVLSMHHILLDGAAIERLVTDLVESIVGPATVGIAEDSKVRYPLANRELLRLCGDVSEHLSFWRDQIQALPADPGYPTDRTRGPTRSFLARRSRARIGGELLVALRVIAQDERATLYTLLLTALASVLVQWSGRSEVMIGSAFSLRDACTFEGIMGCHANVLPLCVRADPDGSWRSLLRHVRKVVVAAHIHKHCPADLLQRELTRAVESPARAPVPVLFGLLTAVGSPVQADVEIEELATGYVEGELSFQARASPSEIEVFLDARSDLFSEATCRWLLEVWIEALRGLAHTPDAQRLCTATVFRPQPPLEELVAPSSLFAAFEEVAERSADQLAIQAGRDAWTYADLRRSAVGVAAALLGIGHSGPVGVLCGRPHQAVAALLGALRLGCPYVPLNSTDPPDRIKQVAEAAGLAVILTDDALFGLAVELAPGVRAIDVGRVPPQDDLPWPCPAHSGTLAYVLFTSGSTGLPKGCIQNHGNVLHHARTYAASLGLGPEDRLTLVASVAYDAAAMDIFGALLSGASLHPWSLRNQGIDDLYPWLCEAGLTILHVTPSIFRAIAAGSRSDCRPNALRFVVLGGETARKADLELFKRCFSANCTLVNGYGPTESTIATQAFFASGDVCPYATLPIGQALARTEVALVGDDGQDSTLHGEIEIRGPHVFLGYLTNRDDWGRFAVAPSGVRSYRTGDLARRLPDAQLLYLGRRDDQVKIDGIRVEPAESELALLSFSEVAEATVVPRPGVAGRTVLVAYVVFRAGRRVSVEGLRTRLRRALPEPLVPASIIALDRLSYLANGKVDRGALPAPTRAAGLPRKRHPSRWELHLTAVWREVLQLQARPDPNDTFVALGGHSLDALRVMEILRRRFGIDLPPSALLADTPLGDLAADFGRASQDRGSTVGPSLQPPPPLHALSALQRRLWFLDQAFPESSGNYVLAALAFPERADRSALERALAEVVVRHAMLRSRVVEEGRSRVVDPPGLLRIEWAETPTPTIPITREDLPSIATAPFDLGAAWPVRAFGLATSHGDYLVLVLHHLAVDAWSVEVLLSEIDAIYEALHDAGPSPALLPALSFESAITRINGRLDPAREAAQLEFWRAELHGAPLTLHLPAEQPRPAAPSFEAVRASIELSPHMTRMLDSFCQTRSLTRATVLLTAFALLLTRYVPEHEMVIGLPVTLRVLPDEETVVGPLLNTVAVRCDVSRSESFATFAARVRASVVAALDHADVPFERVVEAISPPRDAASHPIYQAIFSYHHASNRRVQRAVETFSGTISCDLAMTVAEVEGTLRLDLDAARGVVHSRLVKRMAEQLVYLFGEALRHPDEVLDCVAVLPPEHRRELLVTLNRSPVKAAHELSSVPEEFERQAARTPEATAIVDSAATLSYRQLAESVNAVAAELVRRGVVAGAFVPIVATNNADFVIAALAVLRSGAAFVPLDPTWPAAMLRGALADTHATVVLNATPEIGIPNVVTLEISRSSLAPSELGSAKRAPDTPMYAIYTSGTTGRPKAAIVADRGVINRFQWMSSFFAAGAPITLQSTPNIYDSAVWQLLWPLVTGGTAVIPRRENLLDASEFTDLVARHRVDVLDFVPSMLVALLPDLERHGELRARLQGVRWVILGGEAVRPSVAARVRRLMPLARIVNLYGPTEASIGCIYYEIIDEPRGRVPIGRPIPNVQTVLLDRRGELAPRGATGELWLLGDCVGLGYLGAQVLRGFERPPVVEVRGARAFRTGDLASWNERGFLEFHGRCDRQLKVRGVRVEPSAIESVLERHIAVHRASVLIRANPDDGQDLLVAYVQMVPGREDEGDGLRRWLRASLPSTSIPDRIEVVANIPIAYSGKQDEARLPAPRKKSRQAATGTAFQSRVKRVWAKVLEAGEEFDVDANFFDVGGHSLLLLTLRRELEAEFGRPISIVDLFRHPTLSAQTELFEHLLPRLNGVHRQDPEWMAQCP